MKRLIIASIVQRATTQDARVPEHKTARAAQQQQS
jgi:hypothetical protein